MLMLYGCAPATRYSRGARIITELVPWRYWRWDQSAGWRRLRATAEYRVELTGKGAKFGADCTCPAFYDSGFCKHAVAVALTENGDGGQILSTADATPARIRRYLRSKNVDALAGMIIEIAERDAVLFRKLALASVLTGSDRNVLGATLRKAIDSAVRIRGFVDYAEVPASRCWLGVTKRIDIVTLLAGSKPGGRIATRDKPVISAG